MKLAALSIGLVVSLAVLTGCGDDDRGADAAVPTAPASSDVSTSDASTSTPIEAEQDPADPNSIVPELATDQLPPGRTTTFDDGTTAELVKKDGTISLEITRRETTYVAELPDDADTPYLVATQVDLGQAGPGWVVGNEGGDSTRLSVYVVRNDELVEAAPDDYPPLGGGFTDKGQRRYTWFAHVNGAPYTRVSTAVADQYELYSWEVTGPGEGGGADDDAPRLVATDRGLLCVEDTPTGPVEKDC